MKYSEWFREVVKHISILHDERMVLEDFPTVDFHRLYHENMEPARAAEIAKAVNAFTKSQYKSA